VPSSLIFAALAAAWLIVLVPIFARRRQEVSRTTDAALAARVVRKGSDRPPAGAEAPATERAREEHAMPETDRDRAGGTDVDDRYDIDERYDHGDAEHRSADHDQPVDHGDPVDHEDEDTRPVHTDDVRAGRRYRPGRGGFDPEAAAAAARAKYARRQRTVLFLLLAAITLAALAALVATPLWWAHGAVDLMLVGYLVYLRKQVRIENEVRERRLARLSGERAQQDDQHWDGRWDEDWDGQDEQDWDEDWDDEGWDDEGWDEDPEPRWDDQPRWEEQPAAVSARTADEDRLNAHREPHIPTSANAIPLDLDDEDPDFDELDERLWQPYRRASGE
jgi:hypothetical protein